MEYQSVGGGPRGMEEVMRIRAITGLKPLVLVLTFAFAVAGPGMATAAQPPVGLVDLAVGEVQLGQDGFHPGEHGSPALLGRDPHALLGVLGRGVQLLL